MLRALAAVGLMGFVSCAPALAQEAGDDLPPVSYPEIALRAPDAQGFVPTGWKLESRADGDLDKDGLPDFALVLRGTDEKNVLINPPLGPERYDTNPRMLVVALAGKKGGFRRVLADRTLIPRPDNPSQEDPLSESGGVSIERGTLVVGFYLFMTAGGSDMGNWKYRFRLENERFHLIGYDSLNVNRMSGELHEASVNFLTGTVIEKTGSIETDKTVDHSRKVRTKKIIMLEDIGDGMMSALHY